MTVMLRLLLALALASLTACNLTNTPPAPIAGDVTEATPSDNINSFTATYTDAEIGFAFNYPDGWVARGEAGGYAMLFSFQPDPNDGGEGIAEGKTKMDFILLPPGTTLDSALSDQKSQQDATITREERLTLSSGVQAVRLQANSARGGSVPVLLAEINARILLIVSYGDAAQFDAIVGTLRTL